MSIPSTLKKMIVFSSENKRRLIEGVVKDLSADTGKSESSIIEQALENQILPKDDNARYWLSLLYTGGTLADAYAQVFAFFSAGTLWEASNSNGKPLVFEFCRLLSMVSPAITGKEKELQHLLSQIESICDMLPAGQASSDIALCKRCIDQIVTAPDDLYLMDIAGIILRNWSIVGNHTRTYRALCDIVHISAPYLPDTPHTRRQFLIALTTVSADWHK